MILKPADRAHQAHARGVAGRREQLTRGAAAAGRHRDPDEMDDQGRKTE
jgi:hypothetical protein